MSTTPSKEAVMAARQRTPLVRRKVLYTTLALATACFLVFRFWLMPVKILGESMLPTYRDGTLHFLNRMAYWSQKPKAGDVIGLRSPDGDIYIKRIIGLPGQTITFRRGKVLVDGKPLDEPYAAGPIPRAALNDAIRLGSDSYYVMGDNRNVSVFGSIPRERILGKIVSF